MTGLLIIVGAWLFVVLAILLFFKVTQGGRP